MIAKSPYEDWGSQRFLPTQLRWDVTDPIFKSGMQNLGRLIQHPGQLAPNVNESILPRLAAESQNIAQNYRGIASNQAGAAARSNLPTSIKTALQSALDVAQERAQRGARGEALTASDTQRRADVEQIYKLLDTVLQFISSGRGQAIPGLAAAQQQQGQNQASWMNLAGTLAGANWPTYLGSRPGPG